MTTTAKELRFNINKLFEVLGRGEEVTITYRGKPKAKLLPIQSSHEDKEDVMFGMWKDKPQEVDEEIRALRKGRTFAL
ncbi:MAG: hypothetical protein KU37_04355 [Sulfuricurvum sp. PC08-66]|nr:MAG: hypothetical protein KU37_04355 [Sulfuricurvum sp. PC08-66]